MVLHPRVFLALEMRKRGRRGVWIRGMEGVDPGHELTAHCLRFRNDCSRQIPAQQGAGQGSHAKAKLLDHLEGQADGAGTSCLSVGGRCGQLGAPVSARGVFTTTATPKPVLLTTHAASRGKKDTTSSCKSPLVKQCVQIYTIRLPTWSTFNFRLDYAKVAGLSAGGAQASRERPSR